MNSKFPISYYLFKNIFTRAMGTSASFLTWAVTELARHPDIMRKAQAEIRTSINRQEKLLTFNEIENLTYLKMILKEMLLLNPLVPLLARATRNTCHIFN